MLVITGFGKYINEKLNSANEIFCHQCILRVEFFVVIVHGQAFFKNICKDVKELFGFSGRTETNVGIETP